MEKTDPSWRLKPWGSGSPSNERCVPESDDSRQRRLLPQQPGTVMGLVTTENLLARGYLPEALPPPFSSEDFAAMSGALAPDDRQTLSARFNLSRPGGLRRTLSIPNPMSQLAVAKHISSG